MGKPKLEYYTIEFSEALYSIEFKDQDLTPSPN